MTRPNQRLYYHFGHRYYDYKGNEKNHFCRMEDWNRLLFWRVAAVITLAILAMLVWIWNP